MTIEPGDRSIVRDERIHGLDALRGVLMMLGVVLHTGIVNFWTKLGGEGTVDVIHGINYFIHTFRMPAFFLLSGFFGALLWTRRGPRSTLKNRFDRIVKPFFGFLFLVWPILHWGANYIVLFYAGDDDSIFRAIGKTIGEALPPTSLIHLWFLYYLIIVTALCMSVVVWLERSNLEFLRIRGFVRRTFESPWRSLVILSGINGLWATVFQWGSIPTSSQWLPDLVIVLYYTMFYALGWLIYTSQLDLARVRDYAWTLIGVGLTLSAVYFIATKHLGEEDKSSGVFIVRALAMSGALIAMTRGLMGVFLKHANTGSYGWRYISDASYWVYLFHVFTCWTFPYFLSGWVAPVLLKYLTSILLSLIACLTTYDLFVRSTWIGKLLNGRRYARYSLRLSLMSLVLIFGFAAIGWGHISERNALLVDWKKAGGPMAFIPNADSVIAAGPGTKIPLDGPGDLSRCIPLGRYVHCATAVDRSRARAVCTAWGGQLLIAETEAEHELITDLVVGYTGKPYWVDIDDRETEGKWLWGNGEELAYNRWDVTQPNSHGGNEDCAAANFGGGTRWHDVSCKSRFHFVCEEKTGPPSGRPIK